MKWFETLIKDYCEERTVLLKNEWFTFESWRKRLFKSTRSSEIARLIGVESSLNLRWKEKVGAALNKQENKSDSIKQVLLLIDTHIKKQNNRSFFLVTIGTLLAAVFKFFGADFTTILVIFAFFLASERLIVNETVISLEEIRLIIGEQKT